MTAGSTRLSLSSMDELYMCDYIHLPFAPISLRLKRIGYLLCNGERGEGAHLLLCPGRVGADNSASEFTGFAFLPTGFCEECIIRGPEVKRWLNRRLTRVRNTDADMHQSAQEAPG